MNSDILMAGMLGAALFVTPALGEEAIMTRSLQAASLHMGPLDMVSFWVPLEDGGYEMTATFRARRAEALPMRVVMRLDDGDSASFAMPNFTDALYSFARSGDVVRASVALTSTQLSLAN